MKSMFSSSRVFALCLSATLIILLSGCGGKSLTTISGTVTLDGKPVEDGSIQFIPTGAEGTTEGANIKGGKYTATVSPGKNEVKIFASEDHPTKTIANVEPGKPPVPAKVSIIPEVYNSKTTLSIDVTGSGEHNFDLKSKP